jgi:hypothetical protein
MKKWVKKESAVDICSVLFVTHSDKDPRHLDFLVLCCGPYNGSSLHAALTRNVIVANNTQPHPLCLTSKPLNRRQDRH